MYIYRAAFFSATIAFLCVNTPISAQNIIFETAKPANPLVSLDGKQLYPFPEGKTFFDSIQSFANRIEVMPIDAWAKNGPFFAPDSYYSWEDRYELTFEKYIPIYEFKELARSVSKEEMFACVDQLENASTREKALILIGFYIFDIARHQKFIDPDRNIYGMPLPPRIVLIPSEHLEDQESGKRLLEVLQKYRDAIEEAFPAITTAPEDLKKQWTESYVRCRQEFSDDDLFIFPATITSSGRSGFPKVEPPQDSQITETNKLRAAIMRDYFEVTFHTGNSINPGTGYARGNSSAKAKTLGDIAKQLIASRPREFDPRNVKR